MNVTDADLVIVRGINSDWFEENFSEFWIGFRGSPNAVPVDDAYYVGIYLGAPASRITHVGIVNKIVRDDNSADFFLSAIIKLATPVDPGHPIRKHEYWKLSELGLSKETMNAIRIQLTKS